MFTESLFRDCQNCFLKGEKAWNSYFSKWEVLGKHEEKIPEEELIEEPDKDTVKKRRRKQPNIINLYKSVAIKRAVKRNKNKKLLTESKKSKERRQSKKIVTHSSSASNENLPDDSDNGLVEVDLKAVIMSILKANKNKWEIFNVLSQTFSQNVTQKGSHCLVFNQSPELPSNNLLSTIKDQVLSLKSASGFNEREFGEATSYHLDGKFGNFKFLSGRQQYKTDFIVNQRFGNQSFTCTNDRQKIGFLPIRSNFPPQKNSLLNFRTSQEILKGFPSPNFWNSFPLEKSETLKALAFEKQNKINNEGVEETRNVCSCKRTNDGSLNMENSNFVTPKREPSERKCFSENILQRKRRRLSKLAFFYNEEESESDDDRNVYLSPVIRLQEEKATTEKGTPEKKKTEELDWDQCGSVFDRIKRT